VEEDRRAGVSSPTVNNTLLFHTYSLQKKNQTKKEMFQFRESKVLSEIFPERLRA